MIVVDTNVISELMRPQPSTAVLQWFTEHSSSELFVTSITLAEIRYGLRVMPIGKRRVEMTSIFERYIYEAFDQHILDFTDNSAHIYAEIAGRRKEMGVPLSIADGQIASIALQESYALATRNIKDFQACGLELINPFDHA